MRQLQTSKHNCKKVFLFTPKENKFPSVAEKPTDVARAAASAKGMCFGRLNGDMFRNK